MGSYATHLSLQLKRFGAKAPELAALAQSLGEFQGRCWKAS